MLGGVLKQCSKPRVWPSTASQGIPSIPRGSGLPFSSSSSVCRYSTSSASSKWDAIIIGAGHNGLVAASYLAKAGKKVLVLERRHVVGGAAVTEELHPGYKYSRASYLFSLFRPSIVQELRLKEHGLKLFHRNPSSFTPMLDGRYLMMGADMAMNREEIGKFSAKDAEMYPKYEEQLSKLVSFVTPLLDEAPPNLHHNENLPLSKKMKELKSLMDLGLRAAKFREEIPALWELMTAPASQVLDKWFESEPLKSTLATDAIIGAMTSPSVAGSGYVLLHHVMGEVDGKKGAWCYVEGGMGAVSQAIASFAKSQGVSIQTNAAVRSVLTRADVSPSSSSSDVVGVELEDGTKLESNLVLSNATPEVTFRKLLSSEAQTQLLPDEFRRTIAGFDYTSPVMKINIAMNALPNFSCCPVKDNKAGPQHMGTIHFVENCEQIEEAYRDALNGRFSSRPVIEMTIPSSVDSTLAPAGHHVASLFVQYAPYHLKDEQWDEATKEKYADRVFALIEKYSPGFSASIVHRDILPPPELERVFGLTGGNIFHGAMGLNQLYLCRPAAGYGRYRSPIKGLFLCGSGAHPGGGVMGAPGKNCANAILQSL